MQIHRKTRSFGTKPVTDRTRQSALSAKDALYGWHHPCHFRAPGLHFSTGGAGAQTAGEFDALSRRVRAQQSTSRVGDAGAAGPGQQGPSTGQKRPPVASHAAMSWAQRLKRVFNIDIETCSVCGGSMKVIVHRRSAGDQEDIDTPAW